MTQSLLKGVKLNIFRTLFRNLKLFKRSGKRVSVPAFPQNKNRQNIAPQINIERHSTCGGCPPPKKPPKCPPKVKCGPECPLRNDPPKPPCPMPTRPPQPERCKTKFDPPPKMKRCPQPCPRSEPDCEKEKPCPF